MKNNSVFYLSYGLASALVLWSIQEAFLFILSGLPFVSPVVTATLFGAVTGAVFGILMVMMEGFFMRSKYLINRGLKVGALFGVLSGTIGFFLTHQVFMFDEVMNANPVVLILINSIRWLIITLCVGIGLGIRDENSLGVVRGVINGLVTGIVAGLVISAFSHFVAANMLSRVIAALMISVVFANMVFLLSNFRRKVWLKTLNGNLEGKDIELSKEIHLFGTQDGDDINLQDYQDVQQSHAKLIRYFDNYSLVDNDPFCQTFVNFRVVKEQFLKNGDIIKIGTALFQYCTVA